MTKQKNNRTEPCPFPQLVLTLDVRRSLNPAFLHQIMQTESFACVILYDSQSIQQDETFLQKQAHIYAKDIQDHGAALLIAEDSRIVGRVKADGLHLENHSDALENIENQKKGQQIIGIGNLRDRHSAMIAAEIGVDYLLFGKLGADKKPRAHPRNIQLAQWWAEIMEVPIIVQTGSDFTTFDEALQTSSEFIAVEEMIFSHDNPVMILNMIKEKCKNSPLLIEKRYP
ncbi:thiamine phosphate synthase [Bartonella sp. B41]